MYERPGIDITKFPNVEKWLARVLERDAVKKAFAEAEPPAQK